MLFQMEIGQTIVIDDVGYCVAEHPAAPGMPYGQAGRQATVYQLIAPDGVKRALKVFKPRYRLPALVRLTDKLAPFAHLPGLSVCHRAVLIPQRHTDLLRQHPDLTYAVLMPWIEGPTWTEVLLDKRTLSPGESLLLARSLAEVLATMEQNGLAHCDLSGPNILLSALVSAEPEPQRDKGVEGHLESPVSLVDVEQLYAPGLASSQFLPSGSPGYAHKTATEGLWAPEADRFAGAMLIAEMLGWCDARVREVAHGESYFDPDELQQDGRHHSVLRAVLEQAWSANVARLFERAWRSEILADCATFGEWLVMLPDEAPGIYELTPIPGEPNPPLPPPPLPVEKTEGQARALEQAERWEEAIEVYRRLLASSIDHPHRSWWQTGLACCQEETLLVRLFDDGVAAYRQGDFRATKELLEEVVRRRPGYVRNDISAVEILERLREGKKLPGFLVLLTATLMIVLGLSAIFLMGAWTGKGPVGFLFWTDTPTPTPTFTPTSTWTPTLTNTPTWTPMPTDTPSPTSTPTWTPTWTPTPTATPTATSTPSPTLTPACRLPVDSRLSAAWNRGSLGCPTANSSITWAAWEPFEGGYMLWRHDNDTVYILYPRDASNWTAGSWELWLDKWDGSDPEGVGMSPPSGRYEPKRGFGWLWRTHLGGPDSRLGWATEEEKGFCASIQPFETGFLLHSDTVTYCEDQLYNWATHPGFAPLFLSLYQDGNWQRH